MEKAVFREQRLLLGGKLYPFDKLTQEEINRFRAQQRHEWAIQAKQNTKEVLNIHISSAPPVTSLTTFFPSKFKPTSENGKEVIPDYLPLWLREWYQLRKNNVKTKKLIKLNAPNTFPVHPFYNTLRHKQIVTEKTKSVKCPRAGWVKVEEKDPYKYPRWSWCQVFPDKRQPVVDPETGWVKIKERYSGQHPQWSQSWRGMQDEFESDWLKHRPKVPRNPFIEEIDGIYRGSFPTRNESGYEVFGSTIRRGKTSIVSYYYVPKSDVPQKRIILDKSDKPKHEKRMRELMKTHSKYVQYTARNYMLLESPRSLWEMAIGYFMTKGKVEIPAEFFFSEAVVRGRSILKIDYPQVFKQYPKVRAEDLESILWEAILLGKGTNKEALKYALGDFLNTKIQTKEKYGDVEFVSFPEDEKQERLDINRIRKKWEMEISRPESDDTYGLSKEDVAYIVDAHYKKSGFFSEKMR